MDEATMAVDAGLDLPALRERLEQATPGPWRVASAAGPEWRSVRDSADSDALASDVYPHDAVLLVELRNNAPALLDELERLREETARLVRERDEARMENRAIRERACLAHAAVFRAMTESPSEARAALQDEGYVHKAVHAVLDGPEGTAAAKLDAAVEAHLAGLGERARRAEQERDALAAQLAAPPPLLVGNVGPGNEFVLDVAATAAARVLDIAGSPPSRAGLFYLLSKRHSEDREFLTWWGPNSSCYSMFLENAGVYTAAELGAQPGYFGNPDIVQVPAELAERFALRSVHENHYDQLLAAVAAGKAEAR